MLRPIALALALTAAAFAPATGAAAPLTEEEAHAIGVDAYLYFYPLVTMDLTRKQLTNQEPSPGGIGGPMNRFANVGAFPTADMKVVVTAEFRYALFERLARSDQGADGRLRARHRRALLPPADARHVDRRVRLAGLAHDGNGSRQFPRHASRLERHGSRRLHPASMRRRLMCGSSAAPRPTVLPTTTPCTRSRPATRSRRCRNGARSRWRLRSRSIPSIDMKTPPKITVDTMPAGQVLRLCRRAAQAASAAHHRSADHRAAEADRLRGRQELRPRQGRSRRPEGLGKRAGGRAEADGVEGADPGPGRQWLVDEHRHHGRLRQLLSEARHRHAARSRRQPARATPSIRSTSPTTPASRSTAPATTRSISTRAKRRRSTPSGRSRFTTTTASRSRIR